MNFPLCTKASLGHLPFLWVLCSCLLLLSCFVDAVSAPLWLLSLTVVLLFVTSNYLVLGDPVAILLLLSGYYKRFSFDDLWFLGLCLGLGFRDASIVLLVGLLVVYVAFLI